MNLVKDKQQVLPHTPTETIQRKGLPTFITPKEGLALRSL